MAKYSTSTGTVYKDRSGLGTPDPNTISDYLKKYFGYDSPESYLNIPRNSMLSLNKKEIAELIEATKEKGNKLTRSEILKITGDSVQPDNKIAFYDLLLDNNKDFFGFNSLGTGEEAPTSIIDESSDTSGIEEYRQLIQELLPKDTQSSYMQQYQNDMYNAINQYEQSTMATLAGSEMEAYRAIGQQQLQLENQIAEQRMRAIKSGVTSAQLASQELAGIFAAQSGASQIASQVMQNKVDAANTFAQQRAAVPGDMYSMLSANQQTAANAYAQLAAAQASYNSYIQQPYRNFDASAKTLGLYGEDYYNTLMGIQKTTK